MSLGGIHCVGSKPLTSPAMRVANAVASKLVIGPMPERPSTMPCQYEARSLARGDRMPRPVMTTRRLDMGSPDGLLLCDAHRYGAPETPEAASAAPGCHARCGAGAAWWSGLDVGLDVVDRLLHRSDLLGFLVRDLALELFLEGHDQLDGVEGIGTQVVDERGAGADLFFLDAQLFDDDLLDALFDAAHWSMAPVEAVAVGSVRDSLGGGTGRLAPFSFNDLAAVADQGMYMPPFTCRVSPVM